MHGRFFDVAMKILGWYLFKVSLLKISGLSHGLREKAHKTDRAYQFWQEGVHPEWIQNDEMMRQKIDYIHNNPVKRGYVDEAIHWRYSSARNYMGQVGLLEICTEWWVEYAFPRGSVGTRKTLITSWMNVLLELIMALHGNAWPFLRCCHENLGVILVQGKFAENFWLVTRAKREGS